MLNKVVVTLALAVVALAAPVTATTWQVPSALMPGPVMITSINDVSARWADGDTVEVRASNGSLNYAGEGLPINVNKAVTIKGMDGVIIRPKTGFSGDLFQVIAGGNLTFQTISLSGKDGGGIQRVSGMINVAAGSATITSSTITDCAVGLKQSGGTLTANSCRVVDNTLAIQKTSGTSNIDNCWWGMHNLGSSGLFSGITPPGRFLILEGSRYPATINVGQTVSLNVTLTRNNLNNPGVGQLPDGITVVWSQSPTKGTLPSPVATVGTQAAGTFTGTTAGTTLLSATVDNQTIQVGTVTVNAVSAVKEWTLYQ